MSTVKLCLKLTFISHLEMQAGVAGGVSVVVQASMIQLMRPSSVFIAELDETMLACSYPISSYV